MRLSAAQGGKFCIFAAVDGHALIYPGGEAELGDIQWRYPHGGVTNGLAVGPWSVGSGVQFIQLAGAGQVVGRE